MQMFAACFRHSIRERTLSHCGHGIYNFTATCSFSPNILGDRRAPHAYATASCSRSSVLSRWTSVSTWREYNYGD